MKNLKHSFDNVYKDAYWEELRKKLGLPTSKGEEDIELLKDLLNLMDESKIDYHNVWVALEKIEMPIQWPFNGRRQTTRRVKRKKSWKSFLNRGMMHLTKFYPIL